MDVKKVKEQRKKQFDRQNDFIKNSYDRINLTLPKGTKEQIKAAAGSASVNSWITSLITVELERIGETATDPNN